MNANILKWDGTVSRGVYFIVGFLGIAIKHNLDRLVATFFFNKPWEVLNYYLPFDQVMRVNSLPRDDFYLLLILLVTALPFIWLGVVLTLGRLRDAALPLWLVLFFFVPFLNLSFFLILSLVPSHAMKIETRRKDAHNSWVGKCIPESQSGSAVLATAVTVLFGLLMTYLGAQIFERYGFVLFVGLPFTLGFLTSVLYGYHHPRRLDQCILWSMIPILILSMCLLAFAIEGVLCIAMAAPLAFILALLGAIVGYWVQRKNVSTNRVNIAIFIGLLLIPNALAAEQILDLKPSLFQNVTTLEMNASPEKVWRHVVGFTEIPDPTELLFRLGIAYPIRAQLDGQGVGALRHCIFSTGEFLEPIEVWDEPRQLKFSVISQPAPMQEWTPYRNIHPAHLDSYLRSNGGQFLLTPLAGGKTLVEATTWYWHDIWPASYWHVWSDYIIHKIHLRVLRHIKNEVEKDKFEQNT